MSDDFLAFHPCEPKVNTMDDISKDADLFFWNENYFLPEGKTFSDLTDEEENELRQKYRFNPYRPGYYRGEREIGAIVFGLRNVYKG